VRVPTFFHTTNHAEEILAGGFIDGHGAYGFIGLEPDGVFLPATPADVNEGAKAPMSSR
jgi:hypothetical protein